MNASIAAATHIGKVRPNNEDTYRVTRVKRGDSLICVVADGMGGHAAGEVASRIGSIRVSASLQRAIRMHPEEETQRMVERAFVTANNAIYKAMRNNMGCGGMGTTMTLACLRHGKIVIGQVGDSRAYLLRGGQLVQITQDHSVVQELMSAGLITPEQAQNHSHRHIITRAMGTSEAVAVDCFTLDWQRHDRVLLCTDGVHDVLSTAEIAAILSDMAQGQEAVDRLIDSALENGGKDNITAVLITYDEGMRAGCGA